VATLYMEDQISISLIKTTSAARSKSQVTLVVNQTSSASRVPASVSLLTPVAGKSTDCHKPRPHICKTCVRPFARLEHLQSHERSHAKEKPCKCQTCMRRFARKDLMLRHKRKLNVTSPAPPRLSGDSMESTTLTLVICDRVCECFVDYDANSALSEELTRDVTLDTDIVQLLEFWPD
jgi:uncharacterized Zn-finger protein